MEGRVPRGGGVEPCADFGRAVFENNGHTAVQGGELLVGGSGDDGVRVDLFRGAWTGGVSLF